VGRGDRAGAPGHLAVVGPTASGKSALAHALAQAAGDVEIVTADSMQVYRGMDIGTAKPTRSAQAEVRHHLLDVVDPSEDFSLARFLPLARAAMADIAGRGRRALLVGGTGLYVQALVDGLEVPGLYPEARARWRRSRTPPPSTRGSRASTRSPQPGWSRRTGAGCCGPSR
jgi:tRNA dimethylallyltransferase